MTYARRVLIGAASYDSHNVGVRFITGTYCYMRCTNAANYADIPADWK